MKGEDGARVMIWPDSVLISCQPPSWTIRWCRRQRAILDRAQVEAQGLDLLRRLGGVGLGVDRVPVVEAAVVEITRQGLAYARWQWMLQVSGCSCSRALRHPY